MTCRSRSFVDYLFGYVSTVWCVRNQIKIPNRKNVDVNKLIEHKFDFNDIYMEKKVNKNNYLFNVFKCAIN